MTEVAIIPGHHPDAPGAAMQVGGGVVHEFEMWHPFARVLAKHVDAEAEVIQRPNKRPDEELAERVNGTKADAAVELHFNASFIGGVSGTEMFHYEGSDQGRTLAEMLQENTLDALGLPDRGARPNGVFNFLKMTEMPAVICEPAFATNDEDAAALVTGLPDLVEAYSTAIEYFLGGA